jgi:hypothetical protein
MEPSTADRGSHIEVLIGVSRLRRPGFPRRARAGNRPLRPKADPRAVRRPRTPRGVQNRCGRREALSAAGGRIVLRGRRTSEAEHFTELVAASRGARMRYFHDVAAARSWLVA